MHVISKKPFADAVAKYPKYEDAIMDTYKALRNGNFEKPEDLQAIFPSLDNFKWKRHWYVIDIAGNNMRLLAVIFFTTQKLLVKYVVPHKEYDELCKKAAKGEL
ncbi:cytoplasmic protein [Mariprofundus erugo]|uniref:type II toxin-antitoxin system HigB family toxin n=1 Tax=Mariprofundus erugo TaxID=2528639 RepID=UPI0010FEE629|nr:type II toxin-antitoxin system HigB family toxin [Mariprofundus erugo]TLS78294.1 cytoplasmic protein [Mariprofundus erugo]